ncbi:hypothetical protein BKP45_09345 [Anaerobacillus alkalidiazotrophicus]|uniref:ABC transporter domain-containing protein n=1 Tax=Anaerobacillus alkalidiazotrophicus TaxID=472963 RepID=A0A1S2M6W3_9BACI|nr:ATP-binding cassette domain-containing protein [Anaerobacillus alkalidiazotrophicus]OIJ20263.1 hypothetical protein BKP45_09345 [Anaerobacillus alkalidiazotrophicus]
MRLLKIENLWKKKGHHFQLRDISIECNEREWILFTGPVGEGKETLKDILVGFDEDWEGSIQINGQEIKGTLEYNDNISFIHKHFFDLEQDTTIFNFLSSPLKLKELTENKISEIILETIKLFPFKVQLRKLINDLSLEEKVVVSFIYAMIIQPKLLIIDEPFYELPNSKRQIISSVIRLISKTWKGAPVFIFSSYVKEWLPICDRITLIHNKTILQTGTIKEMLEKPQHIFVTKYMAENEITFIKGIIKGSQFQTKGLTFIIPLQYLQKHQYFEGQELQIGVPAKNFQIVDKLPSSKDGVSFLAPVHIIKKMNGYYKIYSNIGGQLVVAQIKHDIKIEEGSEIYLFFPFKSMIFFDGKTETILKQRG